MTSRDFCFWLQGYFEINDSTHVSPDQVGIIRRHLALVFKHEIDPSMGADQAAMQAVHDGPGKASYSSPIDYPPGVRC